MELLFLRHGIAEERSHSGSDFDRRLTAEGIAKCEQAARGFAALEAKPTHVWTSPLLRARETAEHVLPDIEAVQKDVLANEPVEELLDALMDLPNDAVVVLVGHEPQASLAVEALLGTRHGRVAMKKAGLAWVSVDLHHWPEQAAALVCLLQPAQLRALGNAGVT